MPYPYGVDEHGRDGDPFIRRWWWLMLLVYINIIIWLQVLT